MTLVELKERMNEMVLNGTIGDDTEESIWIVNLVNMEFHNDQDLNRYLKMFRAWDIITGYAESMSRTHIGLVHLSDVGVTDRAMVNVVTPPDVTNAVSDFKMAYKYLLRDYGTNFVQISNLMTDIYSGCYCGSDLQMKTVGTTGIRIANTKYYIAI